MKLLYSSLEKHKYSLLSLIIIISGSIGFFYSKEIDNKAFSILILTIGLHTFLNLVFYRRKKVVKNSWIVSFWIIFFMVINFLPKMWGDIKELIPGQSDNKVISILSNNWFINEIQPDSIFTLNIDSIANKILLKVNTSNLSVSEINLHNETLLSFLKELIANDTNSIVEQEDIKMQIRLFYVAIISVLITFLLKEMNLLRPQVKFVLLLVILSMYSLEIHNHDMHKRSLAAKFVKIKTYQLLSNKYPSKTEYDLNLGYLDSVLQNATKGSLIRKIKTAFILDTERIIFYIIPLVGLFYYDYSQYKFRPKKKKRLKIRFNYPQPLLKVFRRRNKTNL